jgi:hypothetical protein
MARSRAKDYDDERQIILHRSAQLFAESRYVGTSMNMVADGCRVSKAQRRLKTNFREIFGADRFSTFATVSAKPDVAGLSTIDRRGMD